MYIADKIVLFLFKYERKYEKNGWGLVDLAGISCFWTESIILASFIDETIHNADYMKSYTYCISYVGNSGYHQTITEAWKKTISISFISLALVERHSHAYAYTPNNNKIAYSVQNMLLGM